MTRLFLPAQDITTQNIEAAVNAPAYGPAKDTSVNALHAPGKTISAEAQNIGIPPAVPGMVGNSIILQNPGGSPYTIYTFTANGKMWVASVSLSAGSSGGSGTNLLYARVYTSTGFTLAYCEVATEGAPSSGENGDSNSYPGFAAPAGTVILLDINNAIAPTGLLVRGGGLFVGSIP